jgi:hypothetical protein
MERPLDVVRNWSAAGIDKQLADLSDFGTRWKRDTQDPAGRDVYTPSTRTAR